MDEHLQVVLDEPEPGMDPSDVPPWWITEPDAIYEYLVSLDGVTVEEIGRTAGDRPIVAAAWGDRPSREGRTAASLASALAAGEPGAFYGRDAGGPQTVLFVGATHGTEIEGTVAALNYLNVIVTGRDLIGREMPRVAETGRRFRHLIIPVLNVDGRARFPSHKHSVGVDAGYFSMITQGRWRGGELMRWPKSKEYFPLPLEGVDVLGSYFNDAGVNLAYDPPCGPDVQPETAALLRYARRGMPDLVIQSHSNHGSLVMPPSAYLPEQLKARSLQIGAAVGMRCAREGYPKCQIPGVRRSGVIEPLYQGDVLYHACGALPLLIEFPEGWQSVPSDHRTILDIGLAALDEVCVFGSLYGFLPGNEKRLRRGAR